MLGASEGGIDHADHRNQRAVQTLRAHPVRPRPGSAGAGGERLRLLRPQRGGQIHHVKNDPGPRPPHGGRNHRLWQAHERSKPPDHFTAGRQSHRKPQLLWASDRGRKSPRCADLAGLAPLGRFPGLRPRAADRPGEEAGRALFLRHETASWLGRCPAGLSQAAHLRRTHQRLRPGWHPGDAGTHPLPPPPVMGRNGPNRAAWASSALLCAAICPLTSGVGIAAIFSSV